MVQYLKNFFQKKSSTKILTFRKMWDLYRKLEKGIPKKEEPYLINELIKVLSGITTENYKDALAIMYREDFHIGKHPLEFTGLFIDGVKKNNVFSFIKFIQSIHT